jgi:NitT/TauT family transport system permease protein/taurine transport system permease protein
MVVLFLVWEWAARIWLPKSQPDLVTLMPAPSAVLAAGQELLASGDLLHHLWASLKRELTAFSFALVALPLGIAMGWWPRVNRQLDPVIEILRPIPPIAWIPLSLLWLGIGNAQNQFIIFLGIFFPLLLNTIQGVKNIEPNLVRAARCLGAGELQLLRRVVLPASLPMILTGMRVGFGVGWMALVAAELVGASSGLGFLINDARSVLRTDIVILGMLTIGFVGLFIDLLIRRIAKALLPWSLAAQK